MRSCRPLEGGTPAEGGTPNAMASFSFGGFGGASTGTPNPVPVFGRAAAALASSAPQSISQGLGGRSDNEGWRSRASHEGCCASCVTGCPWILGLHHTSVTEVVSEQCGVSPACMCRARGSDQRWVETAPWAGCWRLARRCSTISLFVSFSLLPPARREYCEVGLGHAWKDCEVGF